MARRQRDAARAGRAPERLRVERGPERIVRRAQAWQAKKADAGWACITWPKEYGGRGATPIQSVIWNQEESNYKTPPNIFAHRQGMLGPTIMAHGTRRAEAALPHDRCCAARRSGASSSASRPPAPISPACARSAVRDGDDWVVNGQKIWTTGAHYCELGHDRHAHRPDARQAQGPHLLHRRHALARHRDPPDQADQRRPGFNEVFFSDVRIPDEKRVGAVNDGWRVAITTLMNERASIGAGGGSARACGPGRAGAQRSRSTAGRRSRTVGVRQRIADFYIRLRGSQYTAHAHAHGAVARQDARSRGVDRQARRRAAAPGAWRASRSSCRALRRRRAATPTFGLAGRGYLASPGLRIAGGTDEILRNIIAERVLGLPPDRAPTRTCPSGTSRPGRVSPEHPARAGSWGSSRPRLFRRAARRGGCEVSTRAAAARTPKSPPDRLGGADSGAASLMRRDTLARLRRASR